MPSIPSAQTPKKTRRRFPRKVGNKTLDQILVRREELLKELEEIEAELSKATQASERTRKFFASLLPQEQRNIQVPQPIAPIPQPTAVSQEYSQDLGSTQVSPMPPEEQVAQLHSNINSQVDLLRQRQSPTPYSVQSPSGAVPEGSPF